MPFYKSSALALIFSVILGPVGLLYASFWGGIFMIVVAIIVINNAAIFPIILCWLISIVWAVGAAEYHNRKLFKHCNQSNRSNSSNQNNQNNQNNLSNQNNPSNQN